ncbi:hypothetical protein ACTXJ3_18015 [Brachybacterium paraconglomeratum]|uniref:hypothetical protein n=1 Tax=Brachybacterium paraconglomeratum TaxID=173362 RepID=UPI003FD3B455
MDLVLSVIGGLVSVATLVGVVGQLTGPERARRRAAREKEALDSAPAALRPAFERMHWEASVHLVAVMMSAASYGRFRGLWVAVSILVTVSLGMFSAMLTGQGKWEPETGSLTVDDVNVRLVAVFFLASAGLLSMAGAMEGSRRRLYRKVFDDLIERKDPDRRLLMEAQSRDAHKRSVGLGLAWGFSASLLVSAMGLNVGLMGLGVGPGVSFARVVTVVLIAGMVGTALTSWFLLAQWTRRPLHTLFPSQQPVNGRGMQ